MIHYYEGTVFNAPAKTLVNTVNCFGVMGAGIALEFKMRYPEMFEDYKLVCEKKEMKVGRPKLYKHCESTWIMNFPTKNHWRNPSKMNYIEEGLKYFVQNYKKANIESIAFPKLGTNKGGLEWVHVKDVMEKYLNLVDIDVYICLDEKKEAEGIEKEMVDTVNNVSMDDLIDKVKLTKKQASIIMETIPLKRFWKLSTKKGIGEKTYEKIFKYYYRKVKSSQCENSKNQNTEQEIVSKVEQLSFF